jgi:hypothetical protein
MSSLYALRLYELVKSLPVASYVTYQRSGYDGEGNLQIVEIDGKASVTLDAHSTSNTPGESGNYCGFETDDMRVEPSGTFSWRGTVKFAGESDAGKPACSVRFSHSGSAIVVESDGCYEAQRCGANTSLNGRYRRGAWLWP